MVTITPETRAATFKWFADHARECARAAQAGEFYVNDVPRYVEAREAEALRYEQGEGGTSLAFLQRAIFIQTGECWPILPARES